MSAKAAIYILSILEDVLGRKAIAFLLNKINAFKMLIITFLLFMMWLFLFISNVLIKYHWSVTAETSSGFSESQHFIIFIFALFILNLIFTIIGYATNVRDNLLITVAAIVNILSSAIYLYLVHQINIIYRII